MTTIGASLAMAIFSLGINSTNKGQGGRHLP